LGDIPIYRRGKSRITNTLVVNSPTRIEPKAKDNFTQVVENQIETSKRRPGTISPNFKYRLNEDFQIKGRVKYPEPEQ
jgi:hypothetical protein